MALQIIQTALQALPFIIQGAQIVFKAFSSIEKLQPGQSVDVPTGYAINSLPQDTIFQTNHSEYFHKKGCLGHQTAYSQPRQIVVKMVNTGKTTINIKPGDVLVSGVLKKFDSVTNLTKTGNLFTMSVNQKGVSVSKKENCQKQSTELVKKTKLIKKNKYPHI